MAYIGNQSTQGFSSIPAKQDLTGASGTSLTLTHAVASAEGIDLFINNVRQEPTTAYSVGGDGVTVTLTGSVVATDDIYVVYNSLALQTTVPPDASVGTAKIIDGSVTKAKMGTTELDLATIKDSTGTNTAITIDSSGRILTPARPAFRVHGTTSAWTNFVSNTKLSLLTSVDYNIGNYYNTTNHEFVAPINGLYHFFGRIYVNNTTSTSDFFISIDDGSLDNSLYWHASESSALDQSSTFSEVIQLTANQTVSIKGNAGAYFPNYSGFGGYLIG